MWNFDRISTNLTSWYVTNIKSYLINVWLKMFHWIIHIFQSLNVLCRVLCKNIWKFSCFLFELIWCFTSTLVGEHKLWNSWSLGTRIFVKYWRKSNNLSSLVLNFRIEIKHMLREIVMVLSKKKCMALDRRMSAMRRASEFSELLTETRLSKTGFILKRALYLFWRKSPYYFW